MIFPARLSIAGGSPQVSAVMATQAPTRYFSHANGLPTHSIVLLAMLTACPIPLSHDRVAAEEPKPEITEELKLLKEEDVSIAIGLGREQPISQAASNVYVITDEDIRQSGAIDLPTVLRRIPGMEVIQMTGADFDVSVRGDNQSRANKLLVLVDGRSIYLDIQSEEHTSELQSRSDLVCRLLLEKKKKKK